MTISGKRALIRAGLKKMGRDAVTMSALLTLGDRWEASRSFACGCFVGSSITGYAGYPNDPEADADGLAVLRGSSEDPAIKAVFNAHLGPIKWRPYNDPENLEAERDLKILISEVEHFLGFTIEELHKTVPLP